MWRLMHDTGAGPFAPATAEVIIATVREAVAAGTGENWIVNDDGPSLAVIVGGDRVFAMYLAGEGSAGFHAIDPTGSVEVEGEYRLRNGQLDRISDLDTVPAVHAVDIVAHLLATGERWTGVSWLDDAAQP
jgi:hypothetical protein